MTALATLDDLRARLTGEIALADELRAMALLDDVSASVRIETKQQITAGTRTDRLSPRYGRLRLPQRVATAVTAVVDLDSVAVTYEWDGLQVVAVPSGTGALDVTYSHAFDADVLASVAGVVATIAARAYGHPLEAGAVTSESVQGYSYSTGSAAASGGFGLLPAEHRKLRRLVGSKGIGAIRAGSL